MDEVKKQKGRIKAMSYSKFNKICCMFPHDRSYKIYSRMHKITYYLESKH